MPGSAAERRFRNVDLRMKTCSCGRWQTRQFPCEHALSVYLHFERIHAAPYAICDLASYWYLLLVSCYLTYFLVLTLPTPEAQP